MAALNPFALPAWTRWTIQYPGEGVYYVARECQGSLLCASRRCECSNAHPPEVVCRADLARVIGLMRNAANGVDDPVNACPFAEGCRFKHITYVGCGGCAVYRGGAITADWRACIAAAAAPPASAEAYRAPRAPNTGAARAGKHSRAARPAAGRGGAR